MKTFENVLNKVLGPVANWMAGSKLFSALTDAFMKLTPVTLGVAVLMIIGNFPIQPWLDFLNGSGLNVHFNAAIGATTGIMSVLVAFAFANEYAKKLGHRNVIPAMLAVVCFFLLMPQVVDSYSTVDGKIVYGVTEAFTTTFTGGTGLFVAMFVSGFVVKLYDWLMKKNLVIKMPDSVPPNVSESLAPSILAGIIIVLFFAVRVIFAYTPFMTVFYFVYGLIQFPLQQMMKFEVLIIVIYMLANVMWFFGIHPNFVYSIISPIALANTADNIKAFQSGAALPYLMMAIVGLACGNGFGGQGGTQGLVISMFTAKSERYKAMRKLAIGPSIFNINEPLVFGMPIMLNPICFFPMLLSPLIVGYGALFTAKLLNFTELNPTIQLAWTTPGLLQGALLGAWKFFLIALVVLVLYTIVWFPFFKIMDNKAYREEKGQLEENVQ